MKVNERIRQIRKANGWSQLEMSFEIGHESSDISKVECGKRNPTYPMICDICEACKMSLAEFFKGVEI